MATTELRCSKCGEYMVVEMRNHKAFCKNAWCSQRFVKKFTDEFYTGDTIGNSIRYRKEMDEIHNKL